MAALYFDELSALLNRIAPEESHEIVIECKHFFGGAAAYANGKIFMSLTKVGLALKLPEKTRTALIEGGGTPLKYFPKAPVKKQYVVVSDKQAKDELALAEWIEESISFAQK